MRRLNLGSYLFPIEGYWNVDIEGWGGVDQIVDLNKFPWPWKDGQWDEVRALDILEHLGKLTKVEIIAELARVLKPGGVAIVRVPQMYNPTSLQSLQHAHSFYLDSFEESYAQPHFKLLKRWVQFTQDGVMVPFVTPLRLPIRFLARFGFGHTITFELEKK